MARTTTRLGDKILVWFAPPEWRPRDLGGPVVIPDVTRATQHKYDTRTPRGLDAFVAVHFVLVTAGATAMLWFEPSLAMGVLAAIAVVLIATLFTWGGLFEAKAWAIPLECACLGASAFLVAWLARGTTAFLPVVATSAIVALSLALWVTRYRGISAEPTLGEARAPRGG
jgi:hypothetical protein